MTAVETRILELLRQHYEGEGYTFVEHPDVAILPGFMQGYRPDALALGKDKSIAIEVRLRRAVSSEKTLRALSELFGQQAGWELRVVYGDDLPDTLIASATKEQIESHLGEAEALLAADHPRAALVLGWATIEAIARTLSADFPSAGSRTMRQAVEVLEHLGRLRFEQAQELRELFPLRAKVVHGDFGTLVTTADVEPVLKAARTALQAA